MYVGRKYFHDTSTLDIQRLLGIVQTCDSLKMSPSQTSNKCQENNHNIDEDTPKPNTEEPKLPNGGWAWIVVFGSFMCNVILGTYLN